MASTKSASSQLLSAPGISDAFRSPRITVLGIGNLLLTDEGVGVHLVQRLGEQLHDSDVTIVDGGTTPDLFSLLDDNVYKMIIIDAAVTGEEPGTIYHFDADDLASCAAISVSLHEIGLVDNLRLMKLMGRCPREITILGIEPKSMECGVELSPEIEAKIPRLIELVLDEIKQTKTSMEVDR